MMNIISNILDITIYCCTGKSYRYIGILEYFTVYTNTHIFVVTG